MVVAADRYRAITERERGRLDGAVRVRRAGAVRTLKGITGRMWTTVPVLTEAFHLLSPASAGAKGLMDFVRDGGLAVWFLADESVPRAFELMLQYSGQPMDFADASLVVAAESLSTRKIFTTNRKDFDVYRIQRGHRKVSFERLEV